MGWEAADSRSTSEWVHDPSRSSLWLFSWLSYLVVVLALARLPYLSPSVTFLGLMILCFACLVFLFPITVLTLVLRLQSNFFDFLVCYPRSRIFCVFFITVLTLGFPLCRRTSDYLLFCGRCAIAHPRRLCLLDNSPHLPLLRPKALDAANIILHARLPDPFDPVQQNSHTNHIFAVVFLPIYIGICRPVHYGYRHQDPCTRILTRHTGKRPTHLKTSSTP